MDIFAKCNNDRVNEAIEAGIYPFFHTLQSRQDVEVIMEGRRRIMLGSNNYLGLTVHPRVVEAAHRALDKYGTGCSGSRFLNGTLDMHVQLEEELADFVGKEAAVVFSTGFQSNLGIISALCGRNDYIICDRENHASIYDACKLSYGKMLRFKHNDMADLERVLQTVPEKAGKLIVVDGVFSMGGDICNLPAIVDLAQQYGCRTMIDDAHGLGVIGNGGRGTADYFGLSDKVDIIMGTFSKSLASLGGYMASSRQVATFVRHASRPFIFSASVPPPAAAAALEALHILKENPQLVTGLQHISGYMRQGLKNRGIPIRESITPIIPIYTYTEQATLVINRLLYQAGVYVNTVLPPATAPNECLLRTSYMASHTEDLLDEALDIIKKVLDSYEG